MAFLRAGPPGPARLRFRFRGAVAYNVLARETGSTGSSGRGAQMLVLVAEDNERLASFLSKGLQEQGFAVDTAADGEQAAHMARTGAYDVIVLDIMLPRRSGFDVIRQLRSERVQSPIICLTARDGLRYRVTGLDLGADDYLVKPFEFAELLARIRALRRRPPDMAPQVLRCADLELDPATRQVRRAGAAIDLTSKEYALLEYLMRRQEAVVTRTSIIQNVWDMHFDSLTNVVDVFVNRLRKKVDYPFEEHLIRTVRGVGYCLSGGEADR